MVVLHYLPTIEKKTGGVGTYIQLLARDLGRLCELHVVTHKSDDNLVIENCQMHYIPAYSPFNVKAKSYFENLIRQLRPDVFHSNGCWVPLTALTVIWASKLKQVYKDLSSLKIVYSPHGMLEPWALNQQKFKKRIATYLYQKKALSISDIIHATADMERDHLLKLGWNENIAVVANCVKIDEILLKSSWSRNRNILFLSRVHPKKGINFLIESVARLKKEFLGYTFTIAGPGDREYIKKLKELVAQNGVSEMFEFIGPVYGDAKWALYRKADLFVLPTWSENFGIVVPEALASGTPVITTVGTPWEELNTCHCGWWTKIGTEPTVEALHSFLECTDACLEEMGRNGRKLVEDRYSSTSVANQFINMYNL